MTKREYIERYEEESGNYFRDDCVFDSRGRYLGHFSIRNAQLYHAMVKEREKQERENYKE